MNIISHAHTVSTSPRLETETRAGALMEAAGRITSRLEQIVSTGDLRQIMIEALGDSDARGLWLWKDAYEVTEIAQVLFLRKCRAVVSRTQSPQSTLAMLAKVTHRRRSEESQSLQPIPLADVASLAAEWLVEGSSIMGLAGDMTLRRVRVMNEFRIKLTGFTDEMRDWLGSIGRFSEMINWKLRFSVPVTDEVAAFLFNLMLLRRLIDVALRS
ncbi:hypothetical protein [Neorhizobium sp. P12A]|uniref:hypothetical protein n=1 Tax=Neorhizobium sp. P12A TaxID=2268027 RepID=UPI00165E9B69|nr:hypothetical protein [Neorhizobium sp. P12A]